MSEFKQLLGTDFNGEPTTDMEELIYDGLDDPRHQDRVPGLTNLMNDLAAPPKERFLSCVALTTWGESAGYNKVVHIAESPKTAPWYDTLIDRKFSVDSTFAQLAVAVSDSDEIAESKGTLAQRLESFRSLVDIADSEYFEDKLGDLLDQETARSILDNIVETVRRGAMKLAVGEPHKFDLATQLVDLASASALADGPIAAELVMHVLNVAASHRTLVHAVTVLHRSKSPEVKQLGEYISSIGDEQVSRMALEAIRTA
ncbi:hypothetical protein ACQB60_10105 [Actinomycetota bacterium Odt1-20B]